MLETAGTWAFLTHRTRLNRPKMRFCPVNSRQLTETGSQLTARTTTQSTETRRVRPNCGKAYFGRFFATVRAALASLRVGLVS
jgi:hypothetical protein